MEVTFYQVKDGLPGAVDAALPKLLEKVLASGHKVVVCCPSEERAKRLNESLWTYNNSSFLPHGTVEDGFSDKQPIYLTTTTENPNSADILVTLSGAKYGDTTGYSRILDMFEASDTQIQNARKRWKNYNDAGYNLAYFEVIDGTWVQKA